MPLIKGRRWMAYDLIVHTVAIHVKTESNKLTEMRFIIGNLKCYTA